MLPLRLLHNALHSPQRRDCLCDLPYSRFSLKAPAGGQKPFGAGVTSAEGYLLALWVHECRRVFADKLVNAEDKAWVDKTISDMCRQEFPSDLCRQVSRCTVKQLMSADLCSQAS